MPRRAHSAVFDDPNLVSCAGLAPVVALGQRCGLDELVASTLTLRGNGGVNAQLKVPALVAGMVAGADSIDDMDLLRHGGMGRLFDGVRAPSTLGTLLRAFTFGHVRQLDGVAARLLGRLAGHTPLLPGGDRVVLLDVDDTVGQLHGYAKQGVGFGYSGVKGLNALIATVSTPTAAPVIAATRLRKGSTNSTCGAARLVADAVRTARATGAGRADGQGLVILRADSAFYSRDVIAAAGRAGARFSVTARMNPPVRAAIATISEHAWTPIHYPNAVGDDEEGRLISDAEIAEVPLHRVHLPSEGRAHHRPAAGAPGPGPHRHPKRVKEELTPMAAAVRCYYAHHPSARPDCRLGATARVGRTPLCSSCLARRSTLGKGQRVRRLSTGGGEDAIDGLSWISEAAAELRTAEQGLAGAVHRAASGATPGPRSGNASTSAGRRHSQRFREAAMT